MSPPYIDVTAGLVSHITCILPFAILAARGNELLSLSIDFTSLISYPVIVALFDLLCECLFRFYENSTHTRYLLPFITVDFKIDKSI